MLKIFCFIFVLYYISVNFANSFDKSFLRANTRQLVICDDISHAILLFLYYYYYYFVINNVKILYFIGIVRRFRKRGSKPRKLSG